MSHRTRHTSRDRSHHSSHHKYDKYEGRRHRDDSKDLDRYHSRKSSRRDRSHERSRDRSHSRYHRSKSPNHSSRHYHDDNYRSDYKSKNYKDSHDSKSRYDSNENSNSKSMLVAESTFSMDSIDQLLDYRKIGESQQTQYSNFDDNFDIEAQPKTISTDDVDNANKDPYENDAVLEAEKERIQKETLLRLQKHLENEGKKYPPAKSQASHPIFANDGSFLEMFKSMQGNMQQHQIPIQQPELPKPTAIASSSSASNSIARLKPIKRRGGKILKTGIVQKQRIVEDAEEVETQPNDSWNAYLKEVKRYKNVTCSDDNMTRSLVK